MSATERSATVLYIVTDNAVLVRVKQHEGQEVCDAFGVSPQLDDIDGAATLLQQLMGQAIVSTPDIGKILLHIQKSSETVDLSVTAVRYHIVEQVDVGESTIWIAAEQIDYEPRLRADDKLLLKALISREMIDIEIWEQQMDRWIDAKVTNYMEYSK